MNYITRRRAPGSPLFLLSMFTCCVALMCSEALAQETLEERLKFSVSTEAEDENASGFAIAGLTNAELSVIKAAELSAEHFQNLFAIAVKGEGAANQNRALAGKYEVQENRIVFIPRYAPMAGVSYELHFDESKLPESLRPTHPSLVVRSVTLPRNDAPPTYVEHVFPSGEELPENLLKFYLHFSAPMSVGDSYRHVSLIDISGEQPREIELPFLTLEQELWDQDGTRLTLLFDPGRIKRGLKPREEVGPALEEGKTYELVVSADWQDAHGNPIAAEFKKQFRVLAPDDKQPNPVRWQVQAPKPGTNDSLEVAFGEPLDHAMLERVLSIERIDSSGESLPVVGEIRVGDGETTWHFVPESPWAAGEYDLVIETTLEDRSGNSIGRPFEVDIFNQVDRGVPREFVNRKFTIAD